MRIERKHATKLKISLTATGSHAPVWNLDDKLLWLLVILIFIILYAVSPKLTQPKVQ